MNLVYEQFLNLMDAGAVFLGIVVSGFAQGVDSNTRSLGPIRTDSCTPRQGL